MINPKIFVAGILDTKGEEIKYLADCVKKAGGEAIIFDMSLGIECGWADIGLSEILGMHGLKPEDIYIKQRSEASLIVGAAAADYVSRAYKEGRCDGIISFGGSMGATIAATAMRALPIGVPKILLSTINGQVRHFAGTKDVCLYYSIAEAGLNKVTRRILRNAAAAVVAMANVEPEAEGEKSLVGCSMFGITTPCVKAASNQIEREGYDVIIYHATGSGGKSLEEMIGEGLLAGVLDITTHEVVSDYYGTRDSSGPSRLRTASQMGVPQVISLGGTDFLLFEDDEPIPSYILDEEKLRGKYRHNERILNFGLRLDETYEIAQEYIRRLIPVKAPTVLCIPMHGWCANDIKGGLLWIPDQQSPEHSARSTAFVHGLIEALDGKAYPDFEVLLVDKHINDAEFASLMADLMSEMLKGEWQKGSHTELDYVKSMDISCNSI